MNALLNAVNVSPLATNVLLKDSIESASIAEGASKSLTNMEASRITWEQGAYRTSNQSLYAVLAECLAFCGELTISEAKQRSTALEKFYKDRGYVYKPDLPLATRVVRAVFGSRDRRRISTYSLVIRQAMKEDISIPNFAAWVEERGGVQEISLGRSATFVSQKDKAATGKKYFDGKVVLGNAKSGLLSHVADADKLGEACVLIAEQQADGSFDIRALVRSPSALKAAYVALYAQQKDSMAQAKAEIQAANDADGAVAKSA